jgi:Predicted acyltransferases
MAKGPLRIRLDRALTVRVIAIVGVVLFHALTVPLGASGVGWLASRLGGFWGDAMVLVGGVLPRVEQFVIIFFMVAGYFSYRAYQRSRLAGSRSSRRGFVKFFLWRRFWKLVPVFWVALLFSYFVSFSDPFSWDGLRKLAVNASLLKTLWPGYYFSINHAHWYVAVQWQLDLLYPLFLYMVARRSAGFAVGVAWAASLAFSFVVPQFTDAAWLRYFPVRWWAEWSLGVYLADRHLAGERVFPRAGWTMLGAAAALMLARMEGARLIEWLAIRVLLAAAFEAMLLSRSPRLAIERGLAPLGLCSYSLYLLHIPVQQLVAGGWRAVGGDFNTVPGWCVYAVVSGACAFVLARWCTEYVESRFATWGNRWWRRRRSRAGRRSVEGGGASVRVSTVQESAR